jgi:glutamine synthetase
MKADPLILDVLGDHTFGKYIEAKEIEWDKFRTLVTPWELAAVPRQIKEALESRE